MVKVYSPWIEKTGKGKYKYCQRYVDPLRSRPGHIVKRKVTVTLTKKTPQARRQARSMLTRKINRALAEQSEGSNITLQELSDRYQQYLKETGRAWNSRVRAAGNLKFINQYFHGAIAKRITTPMINKYLEWCLYERPRKLSNSSTRLRKVYLSNAYRYGIDHGLVNRNPAIGVRVKWRDESNKKRERIANKYLTDNEVRAILGYCKYLDQRMDYYHLFKFMYLTGMRINEAAGLKKDDFFKKAVKKQKAKPAPAKKKAVKPKAKPKPKPKKVVKKKPTKQKAKPKPKKKPAKKAPKASKKQTRKQNLADLKRLLANMPRKTDHAIIKAYVGEGGLDIRVVLNDNLLDQSDAALRKDCREVWQAATNLAHATGPFPSGDLDYTEPLVYVEDSSGDELAKTNMWGDFKWEGQ